jgi:hypothetical protein
MADRHLTIGICLVLALLSAAPVHGQEASWGLRAFTLGGATLPLRNLGSNAVDLESETGLQVLAEIENSPSFGGGLEFLFPNGDVRIRGQVTTTLGATAKGFLGLCESGRLADPNEGFCALDIGTDARVIDGTAELVFLSGSPDRLIRPTISFGLGIRSFDFESESLDCNPFGGQETGEYKICSASQQILEEPSVNPSLTFGLGLEADRDAIAAFVRLNAVTASYSGGVGSSDGGRQVDLALAAGLAVKVR